MLDLRYQSQPEKFLAKAAPELAVRLLEHIRALRQEPFPHGCKRVMGGPEKLYRIRIGDYRVLYDVDHEQRMIGIVRIEKRSHAYD